MNIKQRKSVVFVLFVSLGYDAVLSFGTRVHHVQDLPLLETFIAAGSSTLNKLSIVLRSKQKFHNIYMLIYRCNYSDFFLFQDFHSKDHL